MKAVNVWVTLVAPELIGDTYTAVVSQDGCSIEADRFTTRAAAVEFVAGQLRLALEELDG